MTKKCAIVCSRGIGDGLLFLIAANNLQKNGYEVTVFHNMLFQLQPWFPTFTIEPMDRLMPPCEYDLMIFNLDHLNQGAAMQAKAVLGECCFLLKATACRGREVAKQAIDPHQTMVANLVRFCRQELRLSDVVKENGITPPQGLVFRRHARRIIMHPTSSRLEHNWSKEKFLWLRSRLIKEGFDPQFILGPGEWPCEKGQRFSNLCDLAAYIYESGFMVGNDSGIGHLSSCLGLKSLIIFESHRQQKLWRLALIFGSPLLLRQCLRY